METMRVGPPHGVLSHRPGLELTTVPYVSGPEDLVTSLTGNRPLINMRLHSWDGPAPL